MKWLKKFFERRETDEEICQRIRGLCKEPGCSYPEMDAQVAIHELCRHLLGEDYVIVDPVNGKQANAIIVCDIEQKYRRQ